MRGGAHQRDVRPNRVALRVGDQIAQWRLALVTPTEGELHPGDDAVPKRIRVGLRPEHNRSGGGVRRILVGRQRIEPHADLARADHGPDQVDDGQLRRRRTRRHDWNPAGTGILRAVAPGDDHIDLGILKLPGQLRCVIRTAGAAAPRARHPPAPP